MSETDTGSPYMKTQELAALIRTTPDAVRMMRHRGTGPKGTRRGRVVLYHRDDVRAWLEALSEADHLNRRATVAA